MYRHVVIRPNDNGGTSVVVDGLDVSRLVLDTGITVEFRRGRAFVTLPVVPLAFVGDFPQALVNALASPDGPCLFWEEVVTVLEALDELQCHSHLDEQEQHLYDRLRDLIKQRENT